MSTPKSSAIACLGFIPWMALGCGGEPTLPATPGMSSFLKGGVAVDVEVTRVPLNAEDPSEKAIGAFTFAGGIEIVGHEAARVHELSDVRVLPGERLVAVTDEGDIVQARLRLDASGQLAGLDDTKVSRLLDPTGRPVGLGEIADSEGVALLPTGDWLVSFERDHRVWVYPSGGGPPRRAPAPDEQLPANMGFEALTAFAADAPDAYLVGSEGGRIWHCRLSGSCRETAFGALLRPGFALTALSAYGADGLALIGRDYSAATGTHISVRLIGGLAQGGRLIDELLLGPPFTHDNFEGLSVVPGEDGALRIYLLSDDNGSATQHTYLLAFDWKSSP